MSKYVMSNNLYLFCYINILLHTAVVCSSVIILVFILLPARFLKFKNWPYANLMLPIPGIY